VVHHKAQEGRGRCQRGKLFSKIIKEITVAARMGGGDVEGNARLRAAVSAAKVANMPKDNIERAIKKGTGELEGASYEEITYEGYGPGGVAVLVKVLTDNKNRAVADIRHLFSKYNGNLGETGCVNWMFEKKGYAAVDKSQVDEETLYDIALSVGADDITDTGDAFEILTSPDNIENLRAALDARGISTPSSRCR
jgi:YebC/PmpR family DNA-binding regulatory protein